MTRTITHLYDTYDEAARAVTMLEQAGVPHSDVSIVGADPAGDRALGSAATSTIAGMAEPGGAAAYDHAGAGDLASPLPIDGTERHGAGTGTGTGTGAGTGAGAGASLGTLLGGGAGLLAGIGSLAIPGVGPVVAAGWLVATLTGAGAGAAAGGLLGALGGAGTSSEHAHVYAEGVRRGGTLVSVRVDDADAARIEGLLEGTGRVDLSARGDEYRAGGWSGFDPDAPAPTMTPTMTPTQSAALDPRSVEIERARAGTHT